MILRPLRRAAANGNPEGLNLLDEDPPRLDQGGRRGFDQRVRRTAADPRARSGLATPSGVEVFPIH